MLREALTSVGENYEVIQTLIIKKLNFGEPTSGSFLNLFPARQFRFYNGFV